MGMIPPLFLAAAAVNRGPQLWTASQIPAKKLWLDASDTASITSSGGLVTQWNDKSGEARHATAAGVNRPDTGINTLNGKNVLTFDGTNEGFDLASAITPTDSKQIAVFMVCKGHGLTLSNKTQEYYINLNPFTNDITWNFQFASETLAVSRSTTAWEVISLLHINLGADDVAEGSVNGTVANSQNTAGLNTNFTALGLEASGMASQGFDGDIAEVIVVDGKVPTFERMRIEGYLAHKWGLTANLPASHPYKTDPPTVADPAWTPDNLTTVTDLFFGTTTSGFFQDGVSSGSGVTPAATNGDVIGTWKNASSNALGNIFTTNTNDRGVYDEGYFGFPAVGNKPILGQNVGWVTGDQHVYAMRFRLPVTLAADNSIISNAGNRTLSFRKSNPTMGVKTENLYQNRQGRNNSLQINVWQTVVFVCNGANFSIYVDGQLDPSGTVSSPTDAITNIRLGIGTNNQDVQVSKLLMAKATVEGSPDLIAIYDWLQSD